ncbi:hypothetical protein C8Q77DRAFT_1153309 [Trametes polyzona]|nr:hypothetical protein C8Q77DRAFT_1153309 [Trametes polyzona]
MLANDPCSTQLSEEPGLVESHTPTSSHYDSDYLMAAFFLRKPCTPIHINRRGGFAADELKEAYLEVLGGFHRLQEALCDLGDDDLTEAVRNSCLTSLRLPSLLPQTTPETMLRFAHKDLNKLPSATVSRSLTTVSRSLTTVSHPPLTTVSHPPFATVSRPPFAAVSRPSSACVTVPQADLGSTLRDAAQSDSLVTELDELQEMRYLDSLVDPEHYANPLTLRS